MDEVDHYDLLRTPTPTRPMVGLTVLAVEDSLYACEALRLLCQRSGGRLRRADCLTSARRHLRVYRPSVVIVDLGLPDGSGAGLIDELARAVPRLPVILGTSGDPFAENLALAAGADGFLAKPVTALSAFQETILAHMPEDRLPEGPRVINQETVVPDPMAFQDDMAHAADVLGDEDDGPSLDYLAQFLSGVARSARDAPLLEAAESLARARTGGRASGSDVARVAGLVQDRLTQRAVI